MNWNNYPNFTKAEFDCKHSGKNAMRPEFMERLQALRTAYGKPMRVTSGFRDTTHPVEAKKAAPGAHSRGSACDIGCNGQQAYELLKLALAMGFTGIGVNQKGSGRFIHLDTETDGPRPNVWNY